MVQKDVQYYEKMENEVLKNKSTKKRKKEIEKDWCKNLEMAEMKISQDGKVESVLRFC
jgi:hypothetical protein